jgi:6-pyruvoyltetrahydropterin/6-carboxytetrahydropterin synthase
VSTFTVSKEIEFDAGHRVPNHKSKCRNPHGHRYKVQAVITGKIVTTPGASNEGMLADFGDLKTLLMENVHDVLDHGFIVYENDQAMIAGLKAMEEFAEESFKVIMFPYIPTAENLAYWTYTQIVTGVANMGFKLMGVEVYETPTSVASYSSYGGAKP